MSWVACDGACARWFHAACVHITRSGDDEWLCEQCGDEQPDDCPMRIATCCQVTCRLTQRSIFACCAYFVRLRVCFLGGFSVSILFLVHNRRYSAYIHSTFTVAH